MLRRIARFSAPFTLVVPAALAWLGGCGGSDVTVAVAKEAGPPSFEAPDAGLFVEEASLTSYCPTNKCPPGWTTCPNSRFPCDVNLRADVGNCGACGNACPAAGANRFFSCVEGQCALECHAAFGRLDCDGLADNGCEAATLNDKHCGRCDKTCPDPANRCALQDENSQDVDCGCPAGKLECDRRCVDYKNDDSNCGECSNACDPTGGGAPSYANGYYGCVAGQCGAMKCGRGFASCDNSIANGCETSIVTAENCGACGKACAAGQICALDSNGDPQCMCPPGRTFCPRTCDGDVCQGVCVDLRSDTGNCGACGEACRGVQGGTVGVCAYGSCELRCGQGQADCNNSLNDGCEVNTDRDPRNCGGCGQACDAVAGQACVAGRCVVEPCDDGQGGEAR